MAAASLRQSERIVKPDHPAAAADKKRESRKTLLPNVKAVIRSAVFPADGRSHRRRSRGDPSKIMLRFVGIRLQQRKRGRGTEKLSEKPGNFSVEELTSRFQ